MELERSTVAKQALRGSAEGFPAARGQCSGFPAGSQPTCTLDSRPFSRRRMHYHAGDQPIAGGC